MIHWLYRYIFRGAGILFVIGMITILLLAVASQLPPSIVRAVTSVLENLP